MRYIPTVEEIKAYRDKHQVSIFEAKRVLDREYLIKQLDDASTVDDLKGVLRRII